MKKMFITALVFLTISAISHAQTTPSNQKPVTPKKEMIKKEVKPATTVNSVTPTKTEKNKPTASTKSSNTAAVKDADKKHKTGHTTTKKKK